MIFIIQQILPEYRYQVLKYLPEKSFRILYSNVSKEGTLTSVTPSENMFIETPIIRVGEKYLQNPFGAIHSLKPKTIIFTPELRNFTFWLLLILKPFYRYKLVSWTHGINNKDFVTGKISFSSRFRFVMMNLSDLVITYSKERAKFLREFISKKIITANNTLDTYTLDEVYDKLSKQSVEFVKEELRWKKDSVNFVYIGRLIAEKEIEKNIELFKELSLRINKQCFFHIIGEGPERERLDTKTNRETY
ncbi:glycosyltransferase, partial [Gelidibacter japonicus]|uniref:glycosyltransferase n=1 Tax=Gelidibacter japonicus TaxID=1962232 RepID=UPI003A9331A6